MTTCGCGRANRDGRRFCGACGQSLEHTCGACGYLNTVDDRFCGGCGARAAPTAIVASAGVGMLDAEAVRALFAELTPAVAEVALPEGVLTQDDLDRYFGGAP